MNHQLAEAKKRANEPVPEPTAAEVEAQYRADMVILAMLQPLEIKHGRGTRIRNRFIKNVGDSWAPHAKDTTTFAATGALRSISLVHLHASPEKREGSIMRRYVDTVTFANNAFDSVGVLRGGYNKDDEGNLYPDPRIIRSHKPILGEVAGFLANRKNLNDYHWPEDSDEQIAQISEYLRLATPSTMARAFEAAEKGRGNEYSFWVRQSKKAQGNGLVRERVNDPKSSLPRIKIRQPVKGVDDSKLIAMMREADEARRRQAERPDTESFERFIPAEATELRQLMFDDTSGEAIRIRNLEDGSGASPYMAQLSVLGVEAAGKAVAKVKEERFSGHSVPVRGSYQRLTADQPPQATEAKKVTDGEKAELEGRTEIEKLVNSDGLRHLGAVLHDQPLKTEHDE
jgi:hypothetical protein